MIAARACPTLTTARLTLAAHSLADYGDVRALWQDQSVVRYIGGKPSTDQECWNRLLRHAGHWALLGFGGWQVRETATHRFVGEVGLHDFHRDISPSLTGAPEAGWVLAPWAHGRGYASEACMAVFDWADLALRAERYVCVIDPNNAASLAVAAKLGFTRFAMTTLWDEPVALLERFQPASKAL